MGTFYYRIRCLLTPKSKRGLVKFTVTGDAKTYDITYKCKMGKACQDTNVPDGWTETYRACFGDYVYCSAQANNKDTKVNVDIYFNGKPFRRVTKSGDYVVATASGILV